MGKVVKWPQKLVTDTEMRPQTSDNEKLALHYTEAKISCCREERDSCPNHASYRLKLRSPSHVVDTLTVLPKEMGVEQNRTDLHRVEQSRSDVPRLPADRVKLSQTNLPRRSADGVKQSRSDLSRCPADENKQSWTNLPRQSADSAD